MHLDWIKVLMMIKKNILKFILIELIICSLYHFYRIKINNELLIYISYTILIVLEYFCCITLIFDKRFSLKHLIFFILLSYLSFAIKNVYSHIYMDDINIIIMFGFMTSYMLYVFCKIIFVFALFNDKKEKYIDKLRKNLSYFNSIWNRFISLKYIKTVFKFLPQNIIIFIFLIINIVYLACFYKNYNDINLYSRVIPTGNAGPIMEPLEIRFENIQLDGDISKICLLFGTYNRVNDSNLEFKLYNKKNKVISKETINTKILKDGDNYCFAVNKIKGNKISNYHIKIIPSNFDNENFVTIFKNVENDEYSMSLIKSSSIISYKMLIIFIFILLFFIINYFINTKEIKEHKYYLLMLVYLVPIMFLMPALEVPDEPTHLFNAYNLSQNGLNADIENTITIPDSQDCLNYVDIENRDAVTSFDKITSCLKNEKNVKVNYMNGTSHYVNKTFIGYVSTAIGIKISDIFSNSPIIIFFTGRLFNMFISFIIIYFAIKITPKYKKILLFVATIPMFIQQMCSVSYDAILNATCLFFFAYCIKLLCEKKKVNLKDNVILTFLLYIIYTIKPVYLPITILILFIPKSCYKSKLRKVISFTLIIMSILLVDKFISSYVFASIENTSNEMSNLQLNYLLHHPMNLFSIALNTFKNYTVFYLQGLVGYFGWFKFHLWNLFIYFYVIVFILLCLSEKNIFFDKIKKNYIIKKIILFIMIVISITGIFGAMYIYWSEFKLGYVDGVQGRYFLPLLPFVSLVLMSKKEKNNLEIKTLYSFINISIIITITVFIIYFY